MTELRLLAAALLIFESANRSILREDRPADVPMALWGLAIAAVVAGGHIVFGPAVPFLTVVLGLLLVNLIRVRMQLITAESSTFSRWRYTPAFAVLALAGSWPWTVVAFLALALRRRNLRGFLLAVAGRRGPLGLSALDVDLILPEPVREKPAEAERGLTLIELIVGMTLLVVISTSLFVASVQRSARLTHVRETARTREAAVSALERTAAVPFADLEKHDGLAFPVPGDGDPGRVRVDFPEEGLARISVTAPRRGAAPIRLTTMRSRRLP